MTPSFLSANHLILLTLNLTFRGIFDPPQGITREIDGGLGGVLTEKGSASVS